MSEAIILPTRKDEAWRYSNTDALSGMDLGTFDQWHDIDVAEGETFRDTIVIADEGDAVSDATELRHLRNIRRDRFGPVGPGRNGRFGRRRRAL